MSASSSRNPGMRAAKSEDAKRPTKTSLTIPTQKSEVLDLTHDSDSEKASTVSSRKSNNPVGRADARMARDDVLSKNRKNKSTLPGTLQSDKTTVTRREKSSLNLSSTYASTQKSTKKRRPSDGPEKPLEQTHKKQRVESDKPQRPEPNNQSKFASMMMRINKAAAAAASDPPVKTQSTPSEVNVGPEPKVGVKGKGPLQTSMFPLGDRPTMTQNMPSEVKVGPEAIVSAKREEISWSLHGNRPVLTLNRPKPRANVTPCKSAPTPELSSRADKAIEDISACEARSKKIEVQMQQKVSLKALELYIKNQREMKTELESRIKETNSELTSHINTTKEQIETSRKLTKKHTESLASVHAKCEKIDRKILKASNKATELIAGSIAKVIEKDMGMRITTIEEQFLPVLDQVRDLEGKSKTSKLSSDEVAARVSEVETCNKNLQVEDETLKSRVGDLEEKSKTSKLSSEESAARISKMEACNKNLQGENETLKSRVGDLEVKGGKTSKLGSEEFAARISEVETCNKNLQVENETLKSRSEEFAAMLSKVEATHKDMDAKQNINNHGLATAIADCGGAIDQIGALFGDEKSFENKFVSLKKNLDSMVETKIGFLQTRNQNLEARYKYLEAINVGLQDSYKGLELRNDNTVNLVKDMEARFCGMMSAELVVIKQSCNREKEASDGRQHALEAQILKLNQSRAQDKEETDRRLKSQEVQILELQQSNAKVKEDKEETDRRLKSQEVQILKLKQSRVQEKEETGRRLNSQEFQILKLQHSNVEVKEDKEKPDRRLKSQEVQILELQRSNAKVKEDKEMSDRRLKALEVAQVSALESSTATEKAIWNQREQALKDQITALVQIQMLESAKAANTATEPVVTEKAIKLDYAVQKPVNSKTTVDMIAAAGLAAFKEDQEDTKLDNALKAISDFQSQQDYMLTRINQMDTLIKFSKRSSSNKPLKGQGAGTQVLETKVTKMAYQLNVLAEGLANKVDKGQFEDELATKVDHTHQLQAKLADNVDFNLFNDELTRKADSSQLEGLATKEELRRLEERFADKLDVREFEDMIENLEECIKNKVNITQFDKEVSNFRVLKDAVDALGGALGNKVSLSLFKDTALADKVTSRGLQKLEADLADEVQSRKALDIDLTNVNSNLASVKQDLTDVKLDLNRKVDVKHYEDSKTNLASVKQDLAGVKLDLNRKVDVKHYEDSKTNLLSVKQDLAGLKLDLNRKVDLQHYEDSMNELDRVKVDVREYEAKMNELRQYDEKAMSIINTILWEIRNLPTEEDQHPSPLHRRSGSPLDSGEMSMSESPQPQPRRQSEHSFPENGFRIRGAAENAQNSEPYSES